MTERVSPRTIPDSKYNFQKTKKNTDMKRGLLEATQHNTGGSRTQSQVSWFQSSLFQSGNTSSFPIVFSLKLCSDPGEVKNMGEYMD